MQEPRGLIDVCLAAHAVAARRDNPSSVVVAQALQASGSRTQALAAALLTTGGEHAPLRETLELLTDGTPVDLADALLSGGHKVPGWGTSFVKGRPDPVWEDMDRILQGTPIGETIAQVTALLHEHGKLIYPNGSCYTAATAIVAGKDPLWIFVQGRLATWFEIMDKC